MALTLVTASDLGAEDVADPLARNYPAVRRGSFTATVRARVAPESSSQTIRVTRVHLDPPRWKIQDRVSATFLRDGKTVTETLQGESVYPEVGRITVSVDPATGRALGGVAAYVKPLSPAELREAGYGPFSLAVDGRTNANGFLPLPELIRDGQSAAEPATLNGKPCVLVTSAGRWGRLSVWLDPGNGHLPIRITQEKSADDLLYEGERVGSVAKDEDGKPVKQVGYKQEYVVKKVGKVGTGRMVTEFTHAATDAFADGSAREIVEEVAIGDVRLVDKWDKDPFVLSAVVPDGTRVTAADDQPIEYVWWGGQIVKDVNQSVARGEVSPFTPASQTPWWVYAAVAVGVAAVAGAVWRLASRRGAAA
ncbi:MAG: hypothetical protein K2X82_16940 [Gemmataceae bacterium]|nr:hypothetical protein [Gemmataceae bacterium]